MRMIMVRSIVAVVMFVCANISHAVLLGSGSFSTHNGTSGIFDSYGLLIYEGTGLPYPSGFSGGIPLPPDYIPLPSGTGTVIIDSSYGDLFSSAVSLLTNGSVDSLTTLFTDDTGFGFLVHDECSLFFGSSDCSLGMDFKGATIDYIEFETILWDVQTPGSDPGGDGHWTDYNVEAVMNLYGSYARVPEPATISLMILGIFGLVLSLRKKTSQQ